LSFWGNKYEYEEEKKKENVTEKGNRGKKKITWEVKV
jgi:hypothetical protein